ncbi:MAG: hypothetical protein KF778_12810 [Rhodocyclaceae bacterium]|nr:hypothetical protein [Rhodocyclaceae bacterium]MBX3669273.1 hypothetical protein [Rhodocyclaceae bacterium]
MLRSFAAWTMLSQRFFHSGLFALDQPNVPGPVPVLYAPIAQERCGHIGMQVNLDQLMHVVQLAVPIQHVAFVLPFALDKTACPPMYGVSLCLPAGK